MGIVQEEERRKIKKKATDSLAQKLYDKQVKDITNISDTEWYKQIKEYWEREKDGASNELLTVSKEKLSEIQMKYKLASWFVTFLTNLESTREVREQVKK